MARARPLMPKWSWAARVRYPTCLRSAGPRTVPRYLGFVLHAPLASFGAVAVGERRPGWDRPGRSALLGMIAAALGIDRSDEAAHLGLERGYGVAVRTDAAGRMLA